MDDSFNPQPPFGLSGKEKLGFVGLIILAILIIYLGFRQMGNNIRGPFMERLAASLAKSSQEPMEMSIGEQLAELQKKDTDKDGLSDYDELNIYQTSPYIADTDSDGVSDKKEIDQQSDPNCPVGKNCGGELTNPTAGATTSTALGLPMTSVLSADQLLLQSVFGSNPDPKILRDFLLKQGIDKKTLDAFTDEELLQVFKEITSATSSIMTPPALPSALLNPQNLTAPELRDLLKQQGVSEEALKKISDKELLEMVKEIK